MVIVGIDFSYFFYYIWFLGSRRSDFDTLVIE